MTSSDSPTPAVIQPGTLAQLVPGPRQLRAELEDLVAKELLGPRGGPDEEVTEGRLQDRYLVGMLAPKNKLIRMSEMDVLAEDGAGSVDEGATDDSSLPADSLYPASIGLTCTVHSEVRKLLVIARWGRYLREKSATATTPQGNPLTVWKRYPMGNVGKAIALVEGDIAPIVLDPNQPEVFLQGLVRKLEGDWIVSFFLVNGQQETEKRKDEAWIYQPELEVRSPDGEAVFRRRNWLRDGAKLDPVQHAEQQALEMQYRHQVEFAVGHGVAVHAETQAQSPTHGVSLVTKVMPTYEVPVTTPPTAEDIPALADLVLDMKVLAGMADTDLLKTLRVVPVAYKAWIAKERTRIADPAEGLGHYSKVANDAMNACDLACARIEAGIDLLGSDLKALRAFRFANEAMWHQRVHSVFAEGKRAGATLTFAELDVPENRSWRPFQLAFIILNLPGVTQLDHPERSDAPSAVADLLWFPTGGGKTEAYLGLTAYTLAIRRLQGVVEGRIGHVGVAVIMRYTLRLLTLQQFQRASALICACEVIRRKDPEVWGAEIFRVGLWV